MIIPEFNTKEIKTTQKTLNKELERVCSYRKPIMFISGPISAPTNKEIQYNVKRAELVALNIMKKGWLVLSMHSCYHWVQHVPKEERPTWKDWINHDLNALYHATAVFVIRKEDGTLSAGTQIEVELAKKLNLTTYVHLIDVPTIPIIDMVGKDYKWSKDWR